MFRGRYDHAVDEKGRTSLPVKFRELLVGAYDDRLIVTCQLDPCLIAYPYAEWAAFEEKLAQRSQFDPSIVELKRFFVANAVECPVDKAGRVLLPQSLRDYAGITSEVVWVGQVKTIELWSAPQWKLLQEDARAPQNVQALRAKLGGLGL
jgi:MraZ protein